jgi:hypothetical protein
MYLVLDKLLNLEELSNLLVHYFKEIQIKVESVVYFAEEKGGIKAEIEVGKVTLIIGLDLIDFKGMIHTHST